MKMRDITESAEDPILDMIKRAQKHFGRKKLYGGNCGTFALALANHFARKGQPLSLAVICYDSWPDGENEDEDVTAYDIISADVPVYHVTISTKPLFYDGDGKVTGRKIQKWVHQEYRDENPALFVFNLTEPGLAALIRSETSWSIPIETFEAFFTSQS